MLSKRSETLLKKYTDLLLAQYVSHTCLEIAVSTGTDFPDARTVRFRIGLTGTGGCHDSSLNLKSASFVIVNFYGTFLFVGHEPYSWIAVNQEGDNIATGATAGTVLPP